MSVGAPLPPYEESPWHAVRAPRRGDSTGAPTDTGYTALYSTSYALTAGEIFSNILGSAGNERFPYGYNRLIIA